MATQPSKPSPQVLAKLKQLREEFAVKAEMERRRQQAVYNLEKVAGPVKLLTDKAKGGSVMGINVATDRKASRSYADLIVDGHKTLESRNSDTLRPYVGKRVAIVRTGEGPAKAIGEVTIGEPMVVNKKRFRELEHQHFVPEGSSFDINTPTKHLYPMHNPERYEQERDVGHGIISRKVIHEAKGGEVMPTHQRNANLAKFLEGSKVKHVVHHGTMSNVKKFKTPAYFGNKDVANQFADPEYMTGSSQLFEGEHPNVMPVHLNLKNPKVFTDEDDYEKHVMQSGLNAQHWIKKGHDGVVFAPEGNMKHPDAYYVAFHPNQIKSAIGNRGTYSKKSGDITKARGGRVTHAHHLDIEERPL